MGLIARELETRGIPTLSMTSAWSITRAVNAPRAVFVDFPLGHTTGKRNDAALQRAILREALTAFGAIKEPGTIVSLAHAWAADDGWKDSVMRPPTAASDGSAASDPRSERHPTPQYQTARDRELAAARAADGGCATCVFLEPPPPTEAGR